MARAETDGAKQEAPPEEGPETEKVEGAKDHAGPERPWVKPVLVTFAILLVALAAGFGIGYATRGGADGPDLTEQEAFAQARESAEREVSRQMARQGFEDGKRSGYRHGVLAGGMRAELDASVIVREQWAGEAQAAAASAQSELAGMTAAPAPPTPDVP